MKSLLTIVISLVVSNANFCQAPATPQEVIQRMINCGCLEGHDSKMLGGMGDAAAVLVTKVVAGKHLSTSEIDSVLTILNISFGGEVTNASDREPRAALFILQLCDLSTRDLELKKRVAQTREYVSKGLKKARNSPSPGP
jgi:hypothetical protein